VSIIINDDLACPCARGGAINHARAGGADEAHRCWGGSNPPPGPRVRQSRPAVNRTAASAASGNVCPSGLLARSLLAVRVLGGGPEGVAALVVAQRHCEPVRCGCSDLVQGAACPRGSEVCSPQEDHVSATGGPAIQCHGWVA
jgi:hypothetical protein